MDVKTSHILPVDLNALMYMNYMIFVFLLQRDYIGKGQHSVHQSHYNWPFHLPDKPHMDAASVTSSIEDALIPYWPGNNPYGYQSNVHVQSTQKASVAQVMSPL